MNLNLIGTVLFGENAVNLNLKLGFNVVVGYNTLVSYVHTQLEIIISNINEPNNIGFRIFPHHCGL